MNIAFLGSGPLAAVVAHRLVAAHPLHVVAEPWSRALVEAGATVVGSLAELARRCDVIVVCAASMAEARERLLGAGGVCEGLSVGKIVIDQTAGDPDETSALSLALSQLGVTLIDAPIHFERIEALSDASAILCGGPSDAFATVRPVLDAIGPKVVHCGESAGCGQAARLVVATAAACNRMVTYECAAMGLRNGLSVADMATVLNRCSGANSGTARVLPALAAGGRSADVPLDGVVADLTRASRLAIQVGAPMLIGNLVRSLLQAESNALGASAHLDDTFRVFANAVNSHATTTGGSLSSTPGE